jgi:hypothetical protein
LVRDHVASGLELDVHSYTMEQLVAAVCKNDDEDDGMWNSLQEAIDGFGEDDDSDFEALPEYNDIGFVDRSRFLSEMYPTVARMEGQHPSQETMDAFMQWLARDKKTFMVTSKAERVMGGYYVRGHNLVDSGTASATSGALLMEWMEQRMRQAAMESVQSKELSEQVEYFYILDPSPLTDEEVEMGDLLSPLLLVTGKNATVLHNQANLWTKSMISALGLLAMISFGVGTCVLQPSLHQRLDIVWETYLAGDVSAINLDWLVELVCPLVLSLFIIQASHEAGHRFVAWRDKVGISFLVC